MSLEKSSAALVKARLDALMSHPIGQHPPVWAGEPVQTTTVLPLTS